MLTLWSATGDQKTQIALLSFHFYDRAFAAMSNEPQNRDARERIAGFMETDLQAPRKAITEEDAQRLQAASGRLDRLLMEVAEQARSKELSEEDVRVLKAAAGRLDELLSGISGK